MFIRYSISVSKGWQPQPWCPIQDRRPDLWGRNRSAEDGAGSGWLWLVYGWLCVTGYVYEFCIFERFWLFGSVWNVSAVINESKFQHDYCDLALRFSGRCCPSQAGDPASARICSLPAGPRPGFGHCCSATLPSGELKGQDFCRMEFPKPMI
jgi:hypothetical protein